ncbi:hypothetical protein STENM223S_10307 [Streptomyces tendae]
MQNRIRIDVLADALEDALGQIQELRERLDRLRTGKLHRRHGHRPWFVFWLVRGLPWWVASMISMRLQGGPAGADPRAAGARAGRYGAAPLTRTRPLAAQNSTPEQPADRRNPPTRQQSAGPDQTGASHADAPGAGD